MRKLFSTVTLLAMTLALTIYAQADTQATTKATIRTDVEDISTAIPAPKGFIESKVPQSPKNAMDIWGLSAQRHATVNPALIPTPINHPAGIASSKYHLKGVVMYNITDPSMRQGVYTVPDLAAINNDITANVSCLAGDRLIVTELRLSGSYVMAAQVYIYDASTWTTIKTVNCLSELNNMAISMAYAPEEDLIYGCFYGDGGNGMELGTMDPATGRRCGTICSIGERYMAMGIKSDGSLIGMKADGSLMLINKASGAETLLASTGLTSTYITAGVVDTRTDTFYYGECNKTHGKLYAINLNDFTMTDISAGTSCEYGGLFIDIPAAENNAPAAITNLAVTAAPLGELRASYSFTAPVEIFAGGASLTGALDYTVYCDDTPVATGKVNPSDKASGSFDVAATGLHTIYVITTNPAGPSPHSNEVSVWTGPDAPKAPENVTLTYDVATLSLSWDAVKASAHNGYFHAGDVVYTVTKHINGHPAGVVAKDTKATSWNEPMTPGDNLDVVKYSVTASFEGSASVTAWSNIVAVGNIHPPYLNDLSTQDDFDLLTVIDANNDGKRWEWNNGCARISFHPSKAMDDWLTLPGAALEGGKPYILSFDARSNGATYPERVEATVGTAPTAEAMQTPVVDKTVIAREDYVTLDGIFTPTASGIYHMGIHGISDANKYYLHIDNVSIASGLSPGEPTNVRLVPDATGKTRTITITCNAPAVTRVGTSLSGLITEVEITRDGNVVKRFDNVTPGSPLTCTDAPAEDGDYTYTIVAINAEGPGKAHTASAHAGINRPAAVDRPAITEAQDTPGDVIVTWKPVAEDIAGNPIATSLVSYEVIAVDADGTECNTVTARVAPATSADAECAARITAVAPGGQAFVGYAIYALTSAGASGRTLTGMIAAGAPYPTPWEESGAMTTILATTGKWSVAEKCNIPACTPADNDASMLCFNPGADNAKGSLITGKIHVNEVKTAAFSFHYYATSSEAYEMTPFVELAGHRYDLSAPISSKGTKGWHMVKLSLVEYAGQDVQVGMTVKCVSYDAILCIDKLELREWYPYDLAMVDLAAPTSMKVGNEYLFNARVKNYGDLDAAPFTVDLIKDGETVASKECGPLAPDDVTTISFTQSPSIFDNKNVAYTARIEFADDDNPANNTSAAANVIVSQTMLPIIDTLDGSESEGTVALSWKRPVTENVVEEVADDMEGYEPFAVDNAGEWQFVDMDNAPGTYTFSSSAYAFPNNGYKGSFIVFDNSVLDISNATGKGSRSGDKSLCCFSNADGSRNDDWMISPLLPGTEQTVTFHARSYTAQYGNDAFEFYYSTTSCLIADMTLLGADTSVPDTWTAYSFTVPEGALYFAIRCISKDTFIFMVDDINYIKANGSANLLGYNVYCDEQPVSDTAVTSESFIHNPAVGLHTYHVSGVYASGESQKSNPFTVNVTSGIDAASARQESVHAGVGEITVEGCHGDAIAICDILGNVIWQSTGIATEITCVKVAPGLYIVKAGTAVVKLTVR